MFSFYGHVIQICLILLKELLDFIPKEEIGKVLLISTLAQSIDLIPTLHLRKKKKKMVCDPQNPIKQDKPRWCSIIWSQIKTLSLLEISATYFLMIQTVGTSRLDFVSFLVSYFWIHEIFWVGPHRQTCSMQILIYKLNHK